MNSRSHFTPRMKPLPARKSALLCVLDVGTTKIVCLIARLMPAEQSDLLRGRTHRCRILGIGHQRSRGLKGGAVIDMEEAEDAIRHAVDAAERMAGVQAESVIVNVSGGRLGSQRFSAQVNIGGRAVGESEIHRVLESAASCAAGPGRTVLHSLPVGYSLDDTRAIRDPRDMIGEKLGADMHVASCDAAAVRNLMVAVERCHLEIEAVVASPYASALSVLVEDEADMGVAVIDMGGGTTSIAIFNDGRLSHVDAIAVGGNHVTTDVARGLTLRVSDAERLKTYYGSCIVSPSDEREVISVAQAGDDENHPTHMPKSQLVHIIRPRVEEILELVRDRLAGAGYAPHAGLRVILTGGACQLTGLPEAARRILSPHVRIGRPLGVQGLPESAKSPAFAASVGLLVYPQAAALEHFEPRRSSHMLATGSDGYIARVGRWLRDSF